MLTVKSSSVSVFLIMQAADGAKVLLLRRTGTLAGLWCQVAGGIEDGEKAWQTALREVREETGIVLEGLWSADICEQFYEQDGECITLVPVFVGIVPENTSVKLNAEHDEYRWASFDDAQTLLTFPGQRRVLAGIKAEFIDKAPDENLQIKTAGPV